MRLKPGMRLPHDLADFPAGEPPEVERNRPVYRVTEVVLETSWGGLYRGKKVFRNFEFRDRRLSEVKDDECLDVLIRTVAYPITDQREYVQLRRDHAWFEATKVLGCRKTNLIPEPLDFLEVRNDQDAFRFPRLGKLPAKEPVLICETIHGENLVRWKQSSAIGLAECFRVLGEILELVDTLHNEKLLLNAFHPAAFWVDTLGRAHFVGTEGVVDAGKASQWRALYPPERYARGFTAAELMQSDAPPTYESDIFGWASIAWLLLTGQSPSKIAGDQQQKWARFEDEHRRQLRDILIKVPAGQRADIRKLLRVDGSRFERAWPDSFISTLFSCLAEQPQERPPSVEALRKWWEKAPPSPVSAAIGVLRPSSLIRLIFPAASASSTISYMVCRKWGEPPRSIDDGTEVWRGRTANVVDDSPPPPGGSRRRTPSTGRWEYSVFTVDDSEGAATYSRGTVAQFLDGTAAGCFRSFAEQIANDRSHGRNLSLDPPPELELASNLDPLDAVATELFASTESVVRIWAVRLLKQHLQRFSKDDVSRELLFSPALKDPEFANRQEAAAALIATTPACDAPLLVRIASLLGGANLDDRIRATRGLQTVGAPARTIEEAIQSFELDRPMDCVVCRKPFRLRDYDQHLMAAHDYVPVDGDLLPLGDALNRLWENLLFRLDIEAFGQLFQEVSKRQGDRAFEVLESAFCARYLRAWDQEICQWSAEQVAHWRNEVAASLANCIGGKQIGQRLLAKDDSRLREVGRACFLANVAERLESDNISLEDYLRSIAFLVPNGEVEERIQVCRTLARLGANPVLAVECECEIEQDRKVACPECGESVARRENGRHRRLQHGIFEFEGERYTWHSLVTLLLERMFSDESDLFAAQTLAELFEERFKGEAALRFANSLTYQALKVPSEDSTEVYAAAASKLAPLPIAGSLCEQLLAMKGVTSVALGLSLFSHAKRQPGQRVVEGVAKLLGQKKLPAEARFAAADAFVRFATDWPELCREGLNRYARGISGDALEAIDALRSLEQRVGESQAIDDVCSMILQARRIRCPKCDQEFNGIEMEEHALRDHARVFDGRRFRRPWAVAMECLEGYAATADSQLLARGEELASVEDSANGRLRFIREALQRGINTNQYRRVLVDAASQSSESVCPSCFELIPADAVSQPITFSGNKRLESTFITIQRQGSSELWQGYAIEGKESAWTGPQPGWWLTSLGAISCALVFCALITASFGAFVVSGVTAAIEPTKWSAILGVVATAGVAIFYRPRCSRIEDVAWGVIVPHVLQSYLTPQSAAFVASLCDASHGTANRDLRRNSLLEISSRASKLVSAKQLHEGCLIAALRLLFSDLLLGREHPTKVVKLMARLLRSVISGEFPLSVLDQATDRGEFFRALPAEVTIAVRWRFVEMAREANWSAADVFVLAKRSTAIQTLIESHAMAGCNPVTDTFAVLTMGKDAFARCAADSAMQAIEAGKFKPFVDVPDLLGQTPNGRIKLCSRGLIIDGTLSKLPPTVNVRVQTQFVQTGWEHQRVDGGPDLRYKHNSPVGYQRETGYELTINRQTTICLSNPQGFVNLIHKCSAFFFGELRPKAEALSQMLPTGAAAKVPSRGQMSCHACGQSVVPKAGSFAQISPYWEPLVTI